jgi:catechol 2,3-dioxygenase-like lactoylglutathione lyase family enzyme
MIKSIGLINGHYECRSLKETVPILTDLLALEVVDEKDGEMTVKHPNTDWLLIFHEGGPDAPDKPLRNHYGLRVATNAEIEKADAYLERKKNEFHIEIMKPRNHHLARSVHFFEPGGNWWEIESYELAVKAGLGANVLPHWTTMLPEERFPGRGYIPQALTHGTIECFDLEISRRFYREVLGLEVVSPSPSVKPHYVKHPSTPWYIVALQPPASERKILGPCQRFTLALESVSAVEEAHRWLKESGKGVGVAELADIKDGDRAVSFLLSDPDKNWWELSSPISLQ